ncbi:NupC/NupG family nucleoside CNT transporter [Staphylococcus pseudintermedius]|uniref:NupC/NupG family nucleoside CNT transporter n=1 Tax=Staphylococcus pseudintermedius TaxID=283734 RepID=A0A317YP44_STAPS|nr:nucleoside transporter C-terminal domain-containing protein [Staphylococcus pseudintermedius]EGQ0294612.1 NupC/NupG family nucleoside CNT transporter [Staphylococcus pseudintermedius]EGQ0311653.1 NupC/NupG family nucleoside CNT transporter [Staphylococcus pseudintermedius]EGQ0313245.1 NupC/NupG family nucleoside CNT transporter [Staphylococcus pseudintermedius]EGQ0322244.1 NupC/NupG family nucleoside CNT transporter [Staphylococcus pseudintermedius]EGQ0358513.1 NupC/NupG family nucleoside C
MSILFTMTGVLFALTIAYLFSFDRKHIDFKKPAMMLGVQVLLVFFMMHTTIGLTLLTTLGHFFEGLIDVSKAGIHFVFGDLENKGGFTFFLNVLLPLVFISVLIGIFNYVKILPFLIKYIGIAINTVTRMGRLESYFAISTAMLGQPEVYLTIKETITQLSKAKLYTIATSGMSAVSMAMLGSYMQMIEPKYVVTAVMLNIFSALIVASVINPYHSDDTDVEIESLMQPAASTDGTHHKKTSFFQMIGDSAMDGFKIAVIVAIMLLAFISLMEAINIIFSAVGFDFKMIIGYIFAPIAWVMGVPWGEAVPAGTLMSTKLITNEFVAMLDFKNILGDASIKTQGIISVYLVSFANFGTVGIIVGSIKGICHRQGEKVAGFAMRLLLGSTLASIISGSMIGLVL